MNTLYELNKKESYYNASNIVYCKMEHAQYSWQKKMCIIVYRIGCEIL